VKSGDIIDQPGLNAVGKKTYLKREMVLEIDFD
jgi:hypothetical protein